MKNLDLKIDLMETEDYKNYKHDIAKIFFVRNSRGSYYIADYRCSGLMAITNDLAAKFLNLNS